MWDVKTPFSLLINRLNKIGKNPNLVAARAEDQSVSAIVTALSEQADHEDEEEDLEEEPPPPSNKTKDKDKDKCDMKVGIVL